MTPDDLGADEQTQTRSRNSVGAVRAVAALKDASSLCFWNTDAVVAHRDASDIGGRFEPHFDVAALWRVLDRVADQVLEHALHAPVVIYRQDG